MQISRDRRSILKYRNKQYLQETDLANKTTKKSEDQLRSNLNDYRDANCIVNKAKSNDNSKYLKIPEIAEKQLKQYDKNIGNKMSKLLTYSEVQIKGRQEFKQHDLAQITIAQKSQLSNKAKIQKIPLSRSSQHFIYPVKPYIKYFPHSSISPKKQDDSILNNNSRIYIKLDNFAGNHEQENQKEFPQPEITISHQYSITFKDTQQTSQQIPFQITRQVAITYISEANLPQEKYNRFRANNYQNKPTTSAQSIKSSMTEQPSQGLYGTQLPFTKLQQIQLFLNMRQTKLKRAQQLLHANQKILLSEHNLQKVIENLNKDLEQIHDKHAKQLLKLNDKLKQQDEQINKLKGELQNQGKQMTKVKNLNDLYVKQNNDLKKKHQNNLKQLQQLRKDLHLTIKENQQSKTILQSYPNSQVKCDQSNTNKNQQNVSKYINYASNDNSVYNPIDPAQIPISINRVQSKLKNCKSQELLHKGFMLGDMDYMQPKFQADVKSQKSYGIRKNKLDNLNPTIERIQTGSEIGQINVITQNELKIQKDKDDKSISSFASFISGKSAIQKVGFIPKPKDRVPKDGMMVDFLMLDNTSNKSIKPFYSKQKDEQLQRFKLNRKQTID